MKLVARHWGVSRKHGLAGDGRSVKRLLRSLCDRLSIQGSSSEVPIVTGTHSYWNYVIRVQN